MPDAPTQSTRRDGRPGETPRTPVSAFSPPAGAWGFGGGSESVKHNQFSKWNQRREDQGPTAAPKGHRLCLSWGPRACRAC